MNTVIKKFSELSTDEIYNILKLRSEVFVVEQNCVYQDIDDKDQKATHLFIEKNNEIIAYTRIFKKGNYYEENPSIGRVVVSKKERGKNLGKEIMLNSIEFIWERISSKLGIKASCSIFELFDFPSKYRPKDMIRRPAVRANKILIFLTSIINSFSFEFLTDMAQKTSE